MRKISKPLRKLLVCLISSRLSLQPDFAPVERLTTVLGLVKSQILTFKNQDHDVIKIILNRTYRHSEFIADILREKK